MEIARSYFESSKGKAIVRAYFLGKDKSGLEITYLNLEKTPSVPHTDKEHQSLHNIIRYEGVELGDWSTCTDKHFGISAARIAPAGEKQLKIAQAIKVELNTGDLTAELWFAPLCLVSSLIAAQYQGHGKATFDAILKDLKERYRASFIYLKIIHPNIKRFFIKRGFKQVGESDMFANSVAALKNK